MNRKFLFLTLLSLFGSVASAQSTIRLDGDFSDWADRVAAKGDTAGAKTFTAEDPVGDALGAFDLTEVSACFEDSTLFVRLKIDEPLNLANGDPSDGTLRMIATLNSSQTLAIDFRGRYALLLRDRTAKWIPWSKLRFAALPTVSSRSFEIQIGLNELAINPVSDLQIQFDGSDQLSKPLQVFFKNSNNENNDDRASVARSIGSRPEQSIRIASLNTLHQGLDDSKRAPMIQALMKSVGADIFCFNEEWEEDPFRRGILKALPGDAGDWNIHWSRSRGICSRFPMQPVQMVCPNATAALIRIPQQSETPVAVVSVHFDCCGYDGSEADLRRIAQAKQLEQDILAKFQGLPIVVIGDFNLVGSSTPLEIINRTGTTTVMLRSIEDESAMTWRGLRNSESFWPGRLDYATVRGLTMVSEKEGLASSGQNAGGHLVFTEASDHAMLVLDARFPDDASN